jgi:predicted dehydrogenase
MLTQPNVDAVLVVTPPAMNKEICLASAQIGKPLLVEKPLARNLADAIEMVQAVRAKGVSLMTAHTLRFVPVLIRLKEAMSSVGPLLYLSLTVRAERPPHPWQDDPEQAGGGVLIENGIHLLDLIRYLTGLETVEVYAEMDRRFTRQVEDMAMVRFTLSNGVRCLVDASRVSASRVCRIDAIGHDCQISVDVDQGTLCRVKGRTIVETEVIPGRPTVVAVLEEFSRSILRNSHPSVSGEDGLQAVAMAEAAYQSARDRRPVQIPLSRFSRA